MRPLTQARGSMVAAIDWVLAPQSADQDRPRVCGYVRSRIELLGGFRMSCKGVPETTVSTSRVQALLAHLLRNGGSPVSRHPANKDRIVGGYFDESGDESDPWEELLALKRSNVRSPSSRRLAVTSTRSLVR